MDIGLDHIIAELAGRVGPDMPPAIAGPDGNALTPPAIAADIDTLEAWLATQAVAAEDMDRRTCAAYMIGGIGWAVCAWLAALDLTGGPPLRRVAIRQERYWWQGGEGGHEYVRYPIAIESRQGPADPRGTIEEIFAPLIAATMVTAGLSSGAQWRLVSDSVAQAYLFVGEALGEDARARARAEAILAAGRLDNGKTGFVEIGLAGRSHWFVSRGGCCRYYTTRGGEYCSSCVLRQRDDQIARYRDYFESILAAE